MSGPEVIGAVTAIIGAFNSSVTLYRDWREKRIERKERIENQHLEQSLVVGSQAVRGGTIGDMLELDKDSPLGTVSKLHLLQPNLLDQAD